MAAKTTSDLEALGLLAAIAIVISMFVLYPFALIWAIGVLSGHAIPYGFRTWLAAFVVLFMVRFRSGCKAK